MCRTRKKPLVGFHQNHQKICWTRNYASCWLLHHLKISSQNLMPNKEEPLVGLGPEQGIEPLVGRSINSMLSAHASMVEVWREVDRAPLLLQHWLNCISTVVSVLPFPWLMSNHPLFHHMPNKEEPLAGLSSLSSLAKIESTIIRYVSVLVNLQSNTHPSKSSSFYIHI